MSAAISLFNKAHTELRGNSRLRWGLLAIALVLLVDGALRWSDWVTRQQQTLTRFQTELAELKSNARDEASLRSALAQAKTMSEAVDARLWTVSSEAVGQARMKDWLTDIVKRAVANQYVVTLAASRELGKPGTSSVPTVSPTLREFRATVSFQLTPRALEGVLLDIEGGEPFAAVETLLVKKQERRVEITVRLIMRIQPAAHV
jgi:hypothetical protein